MVQRFTTSARFVGVQPSSYHVEVSCAAIVVDKDSFEMMPADFLPAFARTLVSDK